MLAQQDATPFTGPDVAWFSLSPMLVLVGTALFLLVVGALLPRWPRGLYAGVTAAAAIAAGVLSMVLWDDISDSQPSTLVGGALAFDTFAMFVTIVICAAVVGVALVAGDHLHRDGGDGPEIYALVLIAAAGGVVMASANDLIVLFLGLETMSLALYVLAASNRRRTKSQESGIKYFVLGGFSSAFFLYGIALVYGSTGSTNLSEIVAAFNTTIPVDRNEALLLAGIALLLVGLGFKVAAVPFHVWTPDVYQGAPTPVTALMASVGKAAAFAAMLRVLVAGLGQYRDDWRPVVWVLAVASLIVGPLLAIVQTDVKRILAYSSINHAGFMLVGLEAAGRAAGEPDSGPGVPSVMVYLMAYAVLVVGTFAVVSLVARHGDTRTDLDSFRGLGHRHMALAVALTVLLVAQAGVPFTSGFIAKFGVIGAAVDESSYALAIIAMLSTVIAAFLYLRIMVSAWIQEAPAGDDTASVPIPFSTGLAITAAVVFTLVVGLYPEWLLDVADSTVQFAR
jgi:NADH-quinone oxidoreductase subunit N